MIQKNKYFLALLVCVLYSCKTLQKKDLLGIYEYNSQISVGKLILNDTTFEYFYDIPLASYGSKGTWSLHQDTIIFQSYDAYRNDYIIVKESVGDSSYVQLLNEYGNPMRGLPVFINDKILKETNSDGKVNIDSYKKGELLKIHFEFVLLDIQRSIYYPKSKDSNVFIIKVIPHDPEKRYFDGEAAKIKNKKIMIDNRKHFKVKD